MRKNCKKGLLEPSFLRSCFQFPVLSLDPCQGSLVMPGHTPQGSRLDPDSLTCFHSLDMHLSHHHRFFWQPLDCWLTLIAITRLAVLCFGFYGTGPLLVQSQPCTCLWSPLAPFSLERILFLLFSDNIFKCHKKS